MYLRIRPVAPLRNVCSLVRMCIDLMYCELLVRLGESQVNEMMLASSLGWETCWIVI